MCLDSYMCVVNSGHAKDYLPYGVPIMMLFLVLNGVIPQSLSSTSPQNCPIGNYDNINTAISDVSKYFQLSRGRSCVTAEHGKCDSRFLLSKINKQDEINYNFLWSRNFVGAAKISNIGAYRLRWKLPMQLSPLIFLYFAGILKKCR